MADVGDIEWYGPPRGKGSVEDVVSHLDPVRDAVRNKGEQMGREAEMLLLAHHKTGKARIRVEGAPPRKLDTYIYLEDEDPGGEGKAGKNRGDRSAMSIEFGWTQTHVFGKKLAKPIHHDGLHILGQVMKRAGSRYRGSR